MVLYGHMYGILVTDTSFAMCVLCVVCDAKYQYFSNSQINKNISHKNISHKNGLSGFSLSTRKGKKVHTYRGINLIV